MEGAAKRRQKNQEEERNHQKIENTYFSREEGGFTTCKLETPVREGARGLSINKQLMQVGTGGIICSSSQRLHSPSNKL